MIFEFNDSQVLFGMFQGFEKFDVKSEPRVLWSLIFLGLIMSKRPSKESLHNIEKLDYTQTSMPSKDSLYNSQTNKVKPFAEKDEESRVIEIIKKYFIETTIHGLKYIFETGRHFSERIFWVIAVLLLWTFCFYLIYEVGILSKQLI